MGEEAAPGPQLTTDRTAAAQPCGAAVGKASGVQIALSGDLSNSRGLGARESSHLEG